jgi:hypothetical protein
MRSACEEGGYGTVGIAYVFTPYVLANSVIIQYKPEARSQQKANLFLALLLLFILTLTLSSRENFPFELTVPVDNKTYYAGEGVFDTLMNTLSAPVAVNDGGWGENFYNVQAHWSRFDGEPERLTRLVFRRFSVCRMPPWSSSLYLLLSPFAVLTGPPLRPFYSQTLHQC